MDNTFRSMVRSLNVVSISVMEDCRTCKHSHESAATSRPIEPCHELLSSTEDQTNICYKYCGCVDVAPVDNLKYLAWKYKKNGLK